MLHLFSVVHISSHAALHCRYLQKSLRHTNVHTYVHMQCSFLYVNFVGFSLQFWHCCFRIFFLLDCRCTSNPLPLFATVRNARCFWVLPHVSDNFFLFISVFFYLLLSFFTCVFLLFIFFIFVYFLHSYFRSALFLLYGCFFLFPLILNFVFCFFPFYFLLFYTHMLF